MLVILQIRPFACLRSFTEPALLYVPSSQKVASEHGSARESRQQEPERHGERGGHRQRLHCPGRAAEFRHLEVQWGDITGLWCSVCGPTYGKLAWPFCASRAHPGLLRFGRAHGAAQRAPRAIRGPVRVARLPRNPRGALGESGQQRRARRADPAGVCGHGRREPPGLDFVRVGEGHLLGSDSLPSLVLQVELGADLWGKGSSMRIQYLKILINFFLVAHFCTAFPIPNLP